ncbi:MAG: thioredoxin family protein, partial [Coprobacillus sp.]
LIVCLSLIVLTGCISTKKVERINIEGIQEIKYEELTKSLNSNVKFILYIGRPDCGDCQEFYPLLEEYVNKNSGTGIYYLNIKNFRDRAKAENATQEEKDFFDNLYKELHFDWTPTIQVISNGKIIKSYQYLDEEYFEIKDRNEQKEKKQKFITEYYQFMDQYFAEE